MGRRFLLMLGMLLLAPPAIPTARGQDGNAPPSPESAPPATSDLPLPKPFDLPAPEGPVAPVEAQKPEPRKAGPTAKAMDQDPPQDAIPPVSTAPETIPGAPTLLPVPTDEPAPTAGGSPAAGRRSRPPADPELTRTDGPPVTAVEPDVGGSLPVDRLPAGKQAVAVTVDVQSPAKMNLHQPAIVRLVIRNTGTSDALQVRIRDELPDGLKYLPDKSNPPAKIEGTSVLTWSMDTMPGGSEKVIAVQVEPTKPGPLDHGVSVWFQTGSKAQTQVFQPRLKIELHPSTTSVLKGQPVEFKVTVTNVGDGPARKVTVGAKLSPGLRHGSGDRGSDEMITEPIPVLAPGQSEEIDPLIADAFRAGNESCTVTARSPDVITEGKDEEARSVATVTVVEPKLTVAVSGPDRRCTDTNAIYTIAVANPGTAPARKVRIIASVPPGARLLAVPKGARYDSASRRLQWSIDAVEPGPDPQKLAFEVKVGDVGKYEVNAEASAEGGLKKKNSLVTDVFGMADLDLAVSERQRVVDVKGKTIFFIVLHNYGTKEATNIRLSAEVSKNLEVTGSFDVPPNFEFVGKDGHLVLQDAAKGGIKSLGAGKDLKMALEVEVTSDKPEVATCRVSATHDGLTVPVEDSAHVKILPPSSRPAEPASP